MRTLPAATRLTQRVGGFGQDDQPRISRHHSEREPHPDRDGARDLDQAEADARFQIELEVLWAGKRAVITSSAPRPLNAEGASTRRIRMTRTRSIVTIAVTPTLALALALGAMTIAPAQEPPPPVNPAPNQGPDEGRGPF